jgi:MFS family permease
MGTSFRWLVGSTWISNLGDGMGLAAGPLLIASQTQDPLLVALAGLLQRLPWLLFGLYAGALADRADRQRMVVTGDLLRAMVLGLLTVTLVTGSVSPAVVLAAMPLLGTAKVFADTASGTLLPMVVAEEDLGIGNARLMTGFLTSGQLVGPAVGAALFAAGMAWPFLTQSMCVALGALLVAQMRLPAIRRREDSRIGLDVVEGFRFTWRNAAVRTLTLAIVTFNITFGAAWSVLVLYATQRLSLGAIGFGILTTVTALGGLAGTAVYDWLERHASLANIMRVGLVIETFTHLGLALTTTSWVALAIMFVFGAHAFIWGTTSRTVRMRAVPTELQGRVGSLYAIGVFGGILAGQAIGGVVARIWGVTAPFWFAFVGSAIFVVLIWGQLSHIAHADEAA